MSYNYLNNLILNCSLFQCLSFKTYNVYGTGIYHSLRHNAKKLPSLRLYYIDTGRRNISVWIRISAHLPVVSRSSSSVSIQIKLSILSGKMYRGDSLSVCSSESFLEHTLTRLSQLLATHKSLVNGRK
jgi:hypothetical protein